MNISVVIPQQDETRALNALHQAFFFSQVKTAHICLIGASGLIGSTLLRQLRENHLQITERQGFQFTVHSLADIDHILFDADGMSLSDADRRFANAAQKPELEQLITEMRQLKQPRKIVVDCTASETVANFYPELLMITRSQLTPRGEMGKYAAIPAFV